MEIEVWSLKSMNIESQINISTFDVYNNGSFCIENSRKKLLNNNNNLREGFDNSVERKFVFFSKFGR